MHAKYRLGTPRLTSLPKDGGVSHFGRSSGRFSEANGNGWAAWVLRL